MTLTDEVSSRSRNELCSGERRFSENNSSESNNNEEHTFAALKQVIVRTTSAGICMNTPLLESISYKLNEHE